MEKEENKKVNAPAANATSTTKEMTETEKLARTPNVSIATPKAQKFDAVDAPTPKVKPTEPTSWQQFMDDYEAKQHNNAIQERAITQLHDKERQAQEKRQRSRQIINSIADGLSAVSNIVTTAHGAPDLGIGKTLLTQKSQERYDKLQKTADDRRKDYLKIVQEGNRKDLEAWLTAKKEERAAGDKERELKVKEAEQKRKEREEERKAKIGEIDLQYKLGKLTEQEYEIALAKARAGHADEYWDAKIAAENRRGTGGSGGGGKKPEYVAYDEQGNEHKFSSYSAMKNFAMQEGTWVPAETKKDTKKSYKNDSSTSTSTPGYSAKPKNAKPKPTGKVASTKSY